MKKSKVRKTSKLKIPTLKRKAWKLFSEYIRRKDANEFGIVKCVTCPKQAHWKEMQASHAIPGRSNGILFDERGVYPACLGCNVFKHGNIYAYIEFLERKHGKAEAWVIIEDLKFQARIPRKNFASELLELIEKYKEKLKALDA